MQPSLHALHAISETAQRYAKKHDELLLDVLDVVVNLEGLHFASANLCVSCETLSRTQADRVVL